jgi:hypothetical protein
VAVIHSFVHSLVGWLADARKPKVN